MPMKETYTCSMCGNSFSQQNNLQKHMMIHAGEKPHQCSVCSKGFSQKPHTCSQCSKGFQQKSEQGKNLTMKKPHKCSQCGKFTGPSNINKHMIHTAKKPQKCFKCGIGFRQKSQQGKNLTSFLSVVNCL